jgi:hypothetical protein
MDQGAANDPLGVGKGADKALVTSFGLKVCLGQAIICDRTG